MSKLTPIFITILPASITEDRMQKITHGLDKKLKDYHVLVIRGAEDTIDFKCFNVEDFTEAKFEEMKKEVFELHQVFK